MDHAAAVQGGWAMATKQSAREICQTIARPYSLMFKKSRACQLGSPPGCLCAICGTCTKTVPPGCCRLSSWTYSKQSAAPLVPRQQGHLQSSIGKGDNVPQPFST